MTIPPGTYTARGALAELGHTSKGTEQVAVQLVVLDGDYQGKTITWYGFFTEAAMERTLKSLRTLGWQSDSILDLKDIDRNEVEIVINEEPDLNGKLRSRVSWINEPGGGPGNGPALKDKMDDKQKREFAARMKGTIVAFNKSQAAPKNGGRPETGRAASGGRKPPTEPARQREPGDDDDIPY